MSKQPFKNEDLFGKVVHHVAHPDVRGVITSKEAKELAEDYWVVLVHFEKAVTFRGIRGRLWECNVKILFDSPGEARAGHDPNWMNKPPYNKLKKTDAKE